MPSAGRRRASGTDDAHATRRRPRCARPPPAGGAAPPRGARWRSRSSASSCGDLILDRRVERLPLDELALDPLALLGALRDDLLLLALSPSRARARARASRPARRGSAPRSGRPPRRCARAESSRSTSSSRLAEPRITSSVDCSPVGVERDEPLGRGALGEPVGPARDRQVALVLLDVGLDLVEPQRRGVVGLDGELELGGRSPAMSASTRLGLGLRGPDLGWGGHGRSGRGERGHGCHRDHREQPSRSATDDRPLPPRTMPAANDRRFKVGESTRADGQGQMATAISTRNRHTVVAAQPAARAGSRRVLARP